MNSIHTFQLNTGRSIGPGYPCYVIAEIGSNHDCSLDKALTLIHSAKAAGADGVKFQSFQVDKLIAPRNKQGDAWGAHPAWDILKRLSLPTDWHAKLKAEADSIGIDFLSAPFDTERLQLLLDLDVPFIKIASGDLTYTPLLQAVAQSEKPIVLSTGIATLEEVAAAISVLKHAGAQDIALLHCVSLYPPEFSEMNLRALATMQAEFGLPVGLSDHTPGLAAVLGAVALGANVIEKHVTDSRALPGPDHPYALEFDEFQQMVNEIRNLEAALGDGIKKPSERELPEKVGARRAAYAHGAISQGAPLTPDNISLVRHAYPEGIAADAVDRLWQSVAAHEISDGALITWADVRST